MKNAIQTSFLLFVIIACVYSNTLDSAWQFDDIPNIINNKALHLENFSYETLWKSSFSREGHKNYRPLPNLSFALNWLIGGSNTVGYHIINILIHWLSLVFLLLSSLVIFESPNLRKRFTKEEAYFISVLASVLWAVHPIQTSAITYIVQRMTSMAAMFYIAAIFFYAKGRCLILYGISHRVAVNKAKGYFFYFLCLLCYFCAFFSKENAVILPLSILLIDILFFKDVTKIQIKYKHFFAIFLLVATIIIVGTAIFVKGNLLFFIDRYNYRPFSISERLLTEPRIILGYLSQLFYPLSDRFSITHDVEISKNLFQPWTTLPSILAVFTIVVIGFFQFIQRPLLALSILFYFLNHIIESTFIPLELVFEHRNYLPSMFLFMPVAWGLNEALKRFKGGNCFVYQMIVFTVSLVIIWFGINTYSRNNVWKTELSLWYDALKKAPNDARPATNVAIALAWKDNPTPRDYDVALALFEKTLLMNKARKNLDSDIYGNIAFIYFQRNQFEKSIEFYKKALDIDPDFIKGRFDMVKPLIMLGRWDEASKEMDLLLNNRKGYLKSDYLNVKGLILLWQNRPDEALHYLRQALHKSPWDSSVYLNIGRALSMAGHYKNAEWFLSRLSRKEPANMFATFCLIENGVKSGNMTVAEKYAEKMLGSNSIVSINSMLKVLPVFYQTVPVSADIIKPVIMKKIQEFLGKDDKQQ